VFNYKVTDVREVLAKEGPIDMCFQVWFPLRKFESKSALKILGQRWRYTWCCHGIHSQA
jgi:hypothetical protein